MGRGPGQGGRRCLRGTLADGDRQKGYGGRQEGRLSVFTHLVVFFSSIFYKHLAVISSAASGCGEAEGSACSDMVAPAGGLVSCQTVTSAGCRMRGTCRTWKGRKGA